MIPLIPNLVDKPLGYKMLAILLASTYLTNASVVTSFLSEGLVGFIAAFWSAVDIGSRTAQILVAASHDQSRGGVGA